MQEKLQAITKSFKGALKRADLPETIRWHDLRHTFATWVSVKAPYAVLRQLLGHSPGTVTFHYTHVPFDELKRVVDELPTLVTPLPTGAEHSPNTATPAPTPHSGRRPSRRSESNARAAPSAGDGGSSSESAATPPAGSPDGLATAPA